MFNTETIFLLFFIYTHVMYMCICVCMCICVLICERLCMRVCEGLKLMLGVFHSLPTYLLSQHLSIEPRAIDQLD